MLRREFLKISSAATAMAAMPMLGGLPSAALAAGADWRRTLVLVELKGGNDGLNTIVPYADPVYRKLRPNLAVPRDRVIQIDETLGFHPRLEPLMDLWQGGQMAAALGTGYPDPNLSHFRGIDIWDTGSDSDVVLEEGWISRLYAESRPPKAYAADGILLGRYRPGPLDGGDARVVSLRKEPAKFLRQASRIVIGRKMDANPALAHLLKKLQDLRSAAENIIAKRIADVTPANTFPDTRLGAEFAIAARLLIAGVQAPVIKLSIDGFDTHVDQVPLHDDLLGELAGAVAAFAREMKTHGLWDRTLVMTYSEFGRRPAENNSNGTDHGTAAPHVFLGGKVRGGLYGDQPDLSALENGNMKHTLHYRTLYATLAREWWGLDAGFIAEKPLGLIT